MHNEKSGCDVFFHESEEMLPKVPFRALIPKNCNRITVAGRIVSADRVALAGIRTPCTCMAMGQAMGAAAAFGSQKQGGFTRYRHQRHRGPHHRTWCRINLKQLLFCQFFVKLL